MTSALIGMVDSLIDRARAEHPQWPAWALQVRPEVYLLLRDALGTGEIPAPSPMYEPLPIETYRSCEVTAYDLIADFAAISPCHDYYPNIERGLPAPPTYWVDLIDGTVAQWDATTVNLLRKRSDVTDPAEP